MTMEDIFERLVDLNKEITYKFGTEAYDIRCKLYDIIQDGRKKVNNGVLDDVSGCFTAEDMEDAYRDGYENDYPNLWNFDINNYR
tara:strand:- start:212 stop:466 length:255 start_codon:yes stop_codon:yes gene_type:complete